MKSKILGYFLGVLAVAAWGAMMPVGDILINGGRVSPMMTSLLRFAIATPILLVVAIALYGKKAIPHGWRTWIKLCVLGGIGVAAMSYFHFESHKTVAPVNASLLEAWVPMLVMVIGLFLGEKLSPRRILSLVVGFVGTLFVLQVLDFKGLRLGVCRIGDLWVFLSGLCWAIYTALGRNTANRLGGLVFTVWTAVFGLAWLFLVLLLSGESVTLPTVGQDWACILFFAIGCTAIAFFAWNKAQKTVPLAHLSFMEYFVPFFAAILGVPMCHAAVTIGQWVGIGVVIFSAAILMGGGKRKGA